ncbi:Hypothetical predicted protein [Mytilus galloprovincialis]|uniref:Reverse transcriptase domain-containing protein n=1 Tax=Mytilus galloprovincialis TaxID=29158 RepID=A0A8B6GY77_MYTGA|nr:Hypothetical predicted protein [Mytilus galloprovincialis]
MGSDNFRKVGTFDFTEGIGTSVSGTASSFSCSNQSVSDKGFSKESVVTRRSEHSYSEGCVGGGQSSFSSRVLFPAVLGSQEEREMRPVLDLSVLNQYLVVPYFKMQTNRSIRSTIHLGTWTTSLDLMDAYFHIPISYKFRYFLRLVWADKVYSFKAMPFGLAIAPLVFTRMFQTVVSYLHTQAVLIHSYLDDSLIKNHCRSFFRGTHQFVYPFTP